MSLFLDTCFFTAGQFETESRITSHDYLDLHLVKTCHEGRTSASLRLEVLDLSLLRALENCGDLVVVTAEQRSVLHAPVLASSQTHLKHDLDKTIASYGLVFTSEMVVESWI
jgi:hypothetical protein